MNEFLHTQTRDQLEKAIIDLEQLKETVVPSDNTLVQMALTDMRNQMSWYLDIVNELELAKNSANNCKFSKETMEIALHRGFKMTHTYFTPGEFIKLSSDFENYEDENGYLLSKAKFWAYRTSQIFQHGWSIYPD